MALLGFGKKASSAAKTVEKPRPSSPEGIVMLFLAVLFDMVNIVLGILDILLIGVALGPLANIVPTIFIGGWQWLRFGKVPIKKALGPLVLNSIPFSKFIPWWVIAVASSLDWKGKSTQKQSPGNKQAAPKVSLKPARAPA